MPEPICTDTELLAALNGRENLFAFLRNKLAWAIDPEDPFTYDDPEAAGRAKAHANLSQILPFSAGDPFLIFLVEFREKFRRGDLREILRGVRRRIKEEAAYRNADLNEMVFVCTLPDGLRFVHFEEREGRQPRMRVFGFDRQTVGETFTLRSVNLPLLRVTTNLMGEVDWTACRQNWQDAWNVEKVTKQFFKDYREVFNEVETKYVHDAPGNARLFVQRFFNRLMFVHFLSKKGWLRAPGKPKSDSGSEYLFDLWKTYQARDKRKDDPGLTFYGKHLKLLFFAALNQPHITRNSPMLVDFVGDVPYLNGGLFEETDDDRASYRIDDDAFLAIWERLFSCYNFTVAESTPDDQDVAVDPEMLGKVFEELVTGRHESGSYYTPRPIVQFMCREALKGYLAHHGAGIERFVDFHDAREITRHEDVLAALRSVKVVDPACGSGAYLLGMLQELMALRLALFNARPMDDESTYRRKLEIIQNSIYGVDLDPFAVNTARLRLWLSLIVESDRNPLNDPSVSVALPNLDFKIEQGDSVSCPDPQNLPAQFNTRTELIRQFEAKKRAHSDVNFHGNKADLKAEIDQLRREISEETPGSTTDFDWRVDFGEVFQPKFPVTDLGGAMNFGGTLVPPPEPGGFDVVLANPPYVRADAQFKHLAPDEVARQAAIAEWKAFRLTLKKSNIYTTLHEKWDLYIPFLERAFQLLKKDGDMIFIIPDAVNANKYAEAARRFFLRNGKVVRIDFCSDMDLFDAGVTNTILHFAKAHADVEHRPIRVRRYAADRNMFDKYFEMLQTRPQAEFGELLFKQSGDENGAPQEGTIPLEQVAYISAGLVIHSDEDGHLGEFGAEDVLSATRDALHSKRFVFGKDLQRWSLRNERFLEWGTERAPGHFRRPTFSEMHDAKEKIVTVRTPGAVPKSTYDSDSLHFDASSIGFIPWHYLRGVANKSIKKTALYAIEKANGSCRMDVERGRLEMLSEQVNVKYLLGVMNSEFTKAWLGKQRRSKLHIYPDDWKKLPIVIASPEEQAAISALVQQCLDRRGQDVAELEAEINERVAALYGL